MMYSMHQHHKGFTLVETLVAITILVIAMVGPLYAVHKSITASNTARDKLIATALAQEGVEYVRGRRDNNYLAGRAWMAQLGGCFTPNTCTVDQGTDRLRVCGGSGCAPLKLTSANLYTQDSGHPVTKFTRTVQFKNVTANEIQVTVTVNWMTFRIPYSVTVTEHLYDWL